MVLTTAPTRVRPMEVPKFQNLGQTVSPRVLAIELIIARPQYESIFVERIGAFPHGVFRKESTLGGGIPPMRYPPHS